MTYIYIPWKSRYSLGILEIFSIGTVLKSSTNACSHQIDVLALIIFHFRKIYI